MTTWAIIKECSKPTYWYAQQRGLWYEVVELDENDVRVRTGPTEHSWILRQDCEIVERTGPTDER